MGRKLGLQVGVVCFVLSSLAHGTITVDKPDVDDRALHEFSFNTTLSFLAKVATDTITYELTTAEHDLAFPFFQIVSRSAETTEKPFIEFLLNSETLARTFYENTFATDAFTITLSFENLAIVSDLTTLTTRRRVNIELGFHSAENADDATDKTTVTQFFDNQAPSSGPSGETVTGTDSGFIVTVGTLPSDVRYLVLAYAPQTAATDAITALTPAQLLDAATRDALGLCFIAQDISALLTVKSFTFRGNNAVGDFRCASEISNDTAYFTALAFADTAGNLTFSSAVHTGVLTRELSGIFDPALANCTAASIHPNTENTFPHPPLMLIMCMMMIFLILGLRWIAISRRLSLKPNGSHHMRCTHKLWGMLFIVVALFIPIYPSVAQTMFDETGDVVDQPTYGFIELLYGFFPNPVLSTPNLAYKDLFKPDGFNISRGGPSALLIGTQWHAIRMGPLDMGPLFRIGIGIEEGRPFFTSGGSTQISEVDRITLLVIPLQVGAGITFHMLNRLLSWNIRGGVQWTLYNQSFQSTSSGGDWFGNFSYFGEAGFKLSLNWIESWASWGLFDSWGIQNTYLSFHVFYLGRLTGSQFVFDSTRISDSIQENLGWFFGFTFEI